MAAPTYTTTSANVGVPSGGIYADNGNFTTDGVNGNTTIGGNTLLSNKKLGAAAAGDIFDFSGAQGILKLGPTSTTLKLNLACTTTNFVDTNANELVSVARSTFSTITATNHNYAVATPNTVLFDQTSGTATATAIGTIGATQYTPTGGVSANYTAIALLA